MPILGFPSNICMKKRSHKGPSKKSAKSKRRAKKLIEKAAKYLSDENHFYLRDKEKLLKLLQSNKSTIPTLFYEVEQYLKSKKKVADVFKFCTLYLNKKIKRKDVLYLL